MNKQNTTDAFYLTLTYPQNMERPIFFLLFQLLVVSSIFTQSWSRTYELAEPLGLNPDIGVSVVPYDDKLWLLSATIINEGTQSRFGVLRINPTDGTGEDSGALWGDPRDTRAFFPDVVAHTPHALAVGGDWYVGPVLDNFDVFLAKFDRELNLLWSRDYTGYYLDFVRTVLPLPDGGYMVHADGLGPEYIYGGYRNDITLLRTDPEGDVIWQKRLRMDTVCVRPQYGNLERLNDGRYVLCFAGREFPPNGSTNGAGPDVSYIALLDSAANVSWIRKIPYTGYDAVPWMRVTPDQEIVFTWEVSTVITTFDTLRDARMVTRYNLEGEPIWETIFSRNKRRACGSMRLTEAGDILLSGTIDDFADSVGDGWLAKVSGTSGSILWEKSYRMASHPFEFSFGLYGVAELPGGDLVVCGALRDTLAGFSPPRLGPSDAWVMRLSADGCYVPGPCGADNLVSVVDPSLPPWVEALGVAPNPVGADGEARLSIPAEASGKVDVHVYNSLGQKQSSWPEVRDQQSVRLPTLGGVYYLVFEHQGRIVTTLRVLRP